MSRSSYMLSSWQRISKYPAGKWIFSTLLCWKAPYFSTIQPRFIELAPGYCEVVIKKRRAILNHLGTVHAAAMCNLAELVGGSMTDATIPSNFRWIPKGMTVEYLKKAKSDLRAVAKFEPIPQFSGASELPVRVVINDTNGIEVFHATISMWISPKKE